MAPSAAEQPALVLTDAPVLPHTLRLAAQSLLPRGARAPADVEIDVCTCCSVSGLQNIPSASYRTVLSVSRSPGHHSGALVGELGRVVAPGGTLLLQEPVKARTPHASEEQAAGRARLAGAASQASLERALLLAGFASWSSGSALDAVGLHRDWAGITPASVGSLQGPLLQPLLLKAVKPEWSSGASFSLKRKTGTSVVPQPAAKPPAAGTLLPAPAAWKLGAGDDDELVDEDSLLTPEDMLAPVAAAKDAAAGCDPAKPMRKACKNCTCGRAEMEEADAAAPGEGASVSAKLTLDQVENPQSACGSCGLGDAFRCAGCPYRGLPPFKLGEKITLGSAALSADA